MNINFVLKKPIITEKGTLFSAHGGYLFQVDTQARKEEIKKAVEKFFKVKVIKVRTMNVVGKKRRALRTKKQSKMADWKKALVFLKEGDKIDLFETGG
jgi:large subunit ribosomal protein L23